MKKQILFLGMIFIVLTLLNNVSGATGELTIRWIIPEPAESIPPTWTSLNNKTCYVNESCSHQITATDSSGIDTYTLNDTEKFFINSSTGYILNATLLDEVVTYYLNASVNDTLGNTAYGVFWINVKLRTPIGNFTSCRYKKFGVYNIKLPWMKETNCI